MKKLTSFIPSAVAVVAAILVSIFLIEQTLVIFLCLAVGMVAIVVTVVRWLHTKQLRWQALVSTLATATLFIGIAWLDIPLRVAFRVYRSEFDRVASEVESGTSPATPFWIGPFKIEMVGRRGDPGTPYLSLNQEEWEIDGFVRHPNGHGFNPWSCITLDDAWSYVAED